MAGAGGKGCCNVLQATTVPAALTAVLLDYSTPRCRVKVEPAPGASRAGWSTATASTSDMRRRHGIVVSGLPVQARRNKRWLFWQLLG